MIKDDNKRVMITEPEWLLEKFKDTYEYKSIGGSNLSQCIRMYMLNIITKEELERKS